MNFLYELNYTLRTIRRKLGFSFLCIIVIALGYIITIPLYSFVKNFAYSSLPFSSDDRLVVVRQTNTQFNFDYDVSSFDDFQVGAIRDS